MQVGCLERCAVEQWNNGSNGKRIGDYDRDGPQEARRSAEQQYGDGCGNDADNEHAAMDLQPVRDAAPGDRGNRRYQQPETGQYADLDAAQAVTFIVEVQIREQRAQCHVVAEVESTGGEKPVHCLRHADAEFIKRLLISVSTLGMQVLYSHARVCCRNVSAAAQASGRWFDS